jgi:hypothetical protein
VWKTHRQALVEAAAECVEVGAGGVAAVRLEELGRHVRRGAALRRRQRGDSAVALHVA